MMAQIEEFVFRKNKLSVGPITPDLIVCRDADDNFLMVHALPIPVEGGEFLIHQQDFNSTRQILMLLENPVLVKVFVCSTNSIPKFFLLKRNHSEPPNRIESFHQPHISTRRSQRRIVPGEWLNP
jgi:hypothetical protein